MKNNHRSPIHHVTPAEPDPSKIATWSPKYDKEHSSLSPLRISNYKMKYLLFLTLYREKYQLTQLFPLLLLTLNKICAFLLMQPAGNLCRFVSSFSYTLSHSPCMLQPHFTLSLCWKRVAPVMDFKKQVNQLCLHY